VRASALLLAAALLLAPGARAAEPPASALPPSGFEGWSLDGAPRAFPGEALYDHIDGGGEPFLELGYETCEVRRYAKKKLSLTVELYRMTDAGAAFGIYAMQCGRGLPDPSLAERHVVGTTQLTLLKGRHLLKLTAPPDACPPRPVFLAFARQIAGALPAEALPALFAKLPEADRVPGSLRLLRGPLSCAALAPPFEGDALLLDRRNTAVAADYEDEPYGSHSLLVAEYPDEAAALKALASLKEHLETGAKVSRESEKEFLFEVHPSSILGRAVVEGKTLTLTWSMIVKTPPAAP